MAPPTKEEHCAKCGYSLHGLKLARCPECGTAFQPNLDALEQVRMESKGDEVT